MGIGGRQLKPYKSIWVGRSQIIMMAAQLQIEIQQLFGVFREKLEESALEYTLKIRRRPQTYYVDEADLNQYGPDLLRLYAQIMQRVHLWNTVVGTQCSNCHEPTIITMSGKILNHFIKLEQDDPGQWFCGAQHRAFRAS